MWLLQSLTPALLHSTTVYTTVAVLGPYLVLLPPHNHTSSMRALGAVTQGLTLSLMPDFIQEAMSGEAKMPRCQDAPKLDALLLQRWDGRSAVSELRVTNMWCKAPLLQSLAPP